jgi:hypothetical protein
MAETKYGHLIVTTLKKNIKEAPWSPPASSVSPSKGGRILFMDNEVVKGAFYLECSWVMPRPRTTPRPTGNSVKPHAHDYDEVICFFGTNPEDFYDLGAEAELTLGGEKHTITKSCIVFIPKGLEHGPLNFIYVDRPVFHFTSGPNRMYF